MRRRGGVPGVLTKATLVAAVLTAGTAGCSSAGSKASASAPPAATAGPAATPAAPTPTVSQDPVASCAKKVDTWVTTTFLLGKDDLGDYQEMGLSGAEGMALRSLEQQLGKTIKTFPAPAPAGLHDSEVRACVAAGAGAANPIGWQ